MPRSACLALLLVASTALAQLPPEKAAGTFTVSPGLEFKLWASEPLFVNPTCIDIDHKGRVWVCESVNYRNTLHRRPKLTRPQGDRIVILEDTTGNGMADKATTFYQHPSLLAPLGIAVAKDAVGPGYKVYVCQSPDILVFEDKDGDGKADGPPKKLLSGFRGIDHDHGVHGILIGPDRKLYFSVGDSGVDGLQSSDGKGRKWTSNSTDCRAGTIWRCDMDGKNLELLAHNFRNQYEPCIDSFGNLFVSDNDDDGNQQTRICHVFPGGNYGYHPRGRGESHWHEEKPGVVPKILRTYFGSPTGMCVYEGKLLPKKYWGQPLHTDAGPRHVRAYHLTPKGATYAVEREDIVTSTDNWFRPSDVCVAPDGSVFVSDWYDPGVGGHGMGDVKMGRIYRLAPKGHKYSVPGVDVSTDQGILNALNSPAQSVRWMAMDKLDTKTIDQVVALLDPVAVKRDDPIQRARTLWQIARRVDRAQRSLALGTLPYDWSDPRFIEQAIRMVRDFQLVRPRDVYKFYASMREQANAPPGVLREALLSLRDQPPQDCKAALYQLMKGYDGKDRHFLAAVGIAVGHQDEKRREILLADFEKQFPQWNDQVAGLVWELRPPRMMPVLGKRLLDSSLSVEQRIKIVDILASGGDLSAGETILAVLGEEIPTALRDRAIEQLKTLLPNKWQKLKQYEKLTQAIEKLLKQAETRIVGLELTALAGRDDQTARVLEFARRPSEPATVRQAAIATLGKLASPSATSGLLDLLSNGTVADQPEVARALGEVARSRMNTPEEKQVIHRLQQLVLEAKQAELRDAAVLGLTASMSGSSWLLDAQQNKTLPTESIPLAGRVLRNSPFEEIRKQAQKLFPAPGNLDPKKLPAISVLAAQRGNAERGKALLAKSVKDNLQCLKCHIVHGVGGQIGPDLSMIGKKASRENLLESILYPSKAIADQYVQWIIQTDKGVTVQGLLVEETPEAVVLRDAEGRDTRISKKEIESREKSLKSIMPEDTVALLREQDLLDLVEYLLTLQTPALAVDYWAIVGPFPNGSGMSGLERVFPPEKSIDREAVYDGKSSKVRWRTVKPGADGYVDLAAFHGNEAADSVSYLYREIESPIAQEATIRIGTDDGAKLWVNGKEVYVSRATRAAAPDQDRVEVSLAKGVNRILLKINNGNNPHGFYFTILSDQELKLVGK